MRNGSVCAGAALAVVAALVVGVPPAAGYPVTSGEQATGLRTGLGSAGVADGSATKRPGRLFARARRLPLAFPARRVVAFAYHESLFHTAVPMHPKGRPLVIDNPWFRPPRHHDRLPHYIVMGSRGRGTPPTSAVDVVLRPRTQVVAPASGRVVDVRAYLLYCRRPDQRVIIRPFGRPRLRVVIFHLNRVRVRRGDRVAVGRTVLGVPRVFRNAGAQYEAYVPGHRPHVHIEVERRPTKPLPGCLS